MEREATQTVSNRLGMKVCEQAVASASDGGLVDGEQTHDGLYLDDELGADDEVHPVAAVFQLGRSGWIPALRFAAHNPGG